MADAVYLTKEGLEKIEVELKELKTVKRKEAVKHIQEAKEFGDLSENSEYEDAKNEQAFVEGRISELEDVVRKAKIIDSRGKSDQVVGLGCKVVVTVDGGDESYTLVGATEANPRKGAISVESPTGKALLGAKKGQKIVVSAPAGKIEYVIKSVESI
ncbi:MAG: transcription elongation factor GreA [Patescibacteria group bacterium]|jgi:transcription elongation factor GreA